MANESKFRIVVETLLKNAGIRAAIGRFNKFIGVLNKVGVAGKKAFAAIKKGLDIALAPLKVFTAVLSGGAGILTAFAASSIKSAASMEMLRTQLQAVMATKKEADKAFAESIKFSVATPFEPEEIVATRVALEGVGVEGQAAVEAVASTAAALNRNILDVAAAVKSMETEPLRNLGIMLKKDGDKFVISYKDKMKQAREVTAIGFANAQQALLGVMLEKFDGGLEAMSRTFKGKMSTLRGALKLWKADFGDEFLPAVKRIIDDLITVFTGTSLKEFGVKLNEHIENARLKVIAAFKTAQQAAAAIKDHLASGGDGFGKIVNAALINAVDIFLNALISGLKASLSIWKVIGITVASAIKEELLKLDLPFMKGFREKAATDATTNLSQETIDQLLVSLGISKQFVVDGMKEQGISPREQMYGAINSGQLSKAQLSAVAAAVEGKATENAFKQLGEDWKNVLEQLNKKLAENVDNMSTAISGVTGTDFDADEVYKAELQKAKSKREAERRNEGAQESATPAAAKPVDNTQSIAAAQKALQAEYNKALEQLKQAERESKTTKARFGSQSDKDAASAALKAAQEKADAIRKLAEELKTATADKLMEVVAAINQLINGPSTTATAAETQKAAAQDQSEAAEDLSEAADKMKLPTFGGDSVGQSDGGATSPSTAEPAEDPAYKGHGRHLMGDYSSSDFEAPWPGSDRQPLGGSQTQSSASSSGLEDAARSGEQTAKAIETAAAQMVAQNQALESAVAELSSSTVSSMQSVISAVNSLSQQVATLASQIQYSRG